MIDEKNTCFGCQNFYITHRAHRPYGCRAFGFISKNLPYLEVFSSSGMQCAYKKNKKSKFDKNKYSMDKDGGIHD